MEQAEDRRWFWERTDVARSGSSGDLAKLFKNEGSRQPGVLAVGAPSVEASLVARETIQNSWDAARELRSLLGDSAPPFELDFEFAEMAGPDKRALIDALDMTGLQRQLEEAGRRTSRSQMGLRGSTCLDELDDLERPLTTLRIVERGTTGMFGPFVSARSKLYLALVSVGFTKKASGAGGSYGYGKAGLIGASITRTVVAYTCFPEQDDDLGVTRRLLGMTYWGQHEVGDLSFTGFARFGRAEGPTVLPFENEAADEVASSLGLDLRRPHDESELGTTFMILQPTVEPSDLASAVARNWWPALEEHLFEVTVRQLDTDGREVDAWIPRPRKDPALRPFIRAFELATVPQDNSLPHEWSKALARTNIGGGQIETGRMGLVADLDGWSYEQESHDDDDVSGSRPRSLVALVRGPRMVVEYLDVGRQPPFVRGVFVASDEIDDLLRQTEPKAHDKWQDDDLDDDVDPRAGVAARSVQRKVREGVADFRRRLRPPAPDPSDISLPVFQDLARRMLRSPRSSVSSPTGDGLISVEVHQQLEPAADDQVLMSGTAFLKLNEQNRGTDKAELKGTLVYRFIEDGRVGHQCPIDIDWPEGFQGMPDGSFRARIDHLPATIGFQSTPYPGDWSARLRVSCELQKAPRADESAA